MASNRSTTIDEEDDRSDWIELHNASLTSVDLEGWALTNDIEHTNTWTFPSITLFPNSYLVVFASGKDRILPGSPLHANFSLNRAGEYLALLDPEGTPTTEFTPSYPEQTADVSYGQGVRSANEIVLLPERAPAKAWIPLDDALGNQWIQPAFDDSDWKEGRTGIGYDYGALIGLDVRQMRGETQSVYARIPFELGSIPELDSLILRIRYEDGYVAFLNGKEIAADNEPASLNWQSGATSNRPDNEATSKVDVDITSARDLLIEGTNVLAIHGLNQGLTSSDILILPELIAQIKSDDPESVGYMLAPTPGMPNQDSIPEIIQEVTFSIPSTVFSDSVNLELSLPEGAQPESEIRYTLDGSQPNHSSQLYTAPILITETVQIRAVSTLPSGGQSVTRSESYIQLSAQERGFNSNLPVLVIENYQNGRPPQNSKQASFTMFFEPGEDGRTDFDAAPTIATRSGIKVRGSSTSGRPKPSLSLEAWNEFDQNKNIAPLGMPSESDWVLWGPYNFDLTLMHNPFIFELSNQIGRYATRTRFVEVFLNINGGPISSGDYYGVYALMEKISRDQDRVDVPRIFPEHDREPGVTGGYIFKIDRPDPGDSGFGAAGQSIKYVYPKEVDIERPERDAQQTYARTFFQDMGRALTQSTLADGESGYAGMIDIDAAIDHHLLNVLAFNVDALRLSGYFHKPRNGKLIFGPIWDFDRALGSTDGRDSNPRVWRSGSGDRGTDFFNYPWWDDMFRDLDFWQRYIDRYQALRQSTFGVGHIHGIIDSMADELREAQVRNLARWNQRPRGSFGGTYQGEVDHMKDWLSDRITFMDSQFVTPPTMEVSGTGDSQQITISSEDEGVIYYTLDGSDPRAMGGNPSDQAMVYNGSLTFNEAATVHARVFDQSHRSRTGPSNPPLTSLWSGMVTQLVTLSTPPVPGDLMITEIHYNPASVTPEEQAVDPSFRNEDFEFIEIRNISSKSIELAGTRFADGIQFTFPAAESRTLAPGEYLSLFKQGSAFDLRYPDPSGQVAGPFEGNLSNGGESLLFQSKEGATLIQLTYDDNWYPSTDGDGLSLVARDENRFPTDPSVIESWMQASVLHGSPGSEDPGLLALEIASIQVVADGIVIGFMAEPGITYIVEYADAVAGSDWQTFRVVPATETGGEVSLTDTHVLEAARYYRLRVSDL